VTEACAVNPFSLTSAAGIVKDPAMVVTVPDKTVESLLVQDKLDGTQSATKLKKSVIGTLAVFKKATVTGATVVTFVRQVSANEVHLEVAINGYDTPVPMTCCVPIKAGGKVHWRAKFLLKPPAVAPLVATV